MKIQYMSDIHLEFFKNKLPPVPTPVGEVLVLAGDIHVGTNAIPWIEQCSYVFDKIFYVLGNHEFYGQKMWKLRKALPTSLAGYSVGNDYKLTKLFDPITNVTILDNVAENYKGINFIGSTLWSNASNYCNLTMNDFNRITHKKGGYRKFKAEDARELFVKNKMFLKTAIKKDQKNVIITHHAPSFSSIYKEYLTNEHMETNTGFATDILAEFQNQPIDLWIHGHTHHNVTYNEYGINVTCNQHGYVNYETVPEFSWEKVWEIE